MMTEDASPELESRSEIVDVEEDFVAPLDSELASVMDLGSSLGDVDAGFPVEEALLSIKRVAGEEGRRKLSLGSNAASPSAAARSIRTTVRLLARVRPRLSGEPLDDSDAPCLRIVSATQIEVLEEKRPLLTDPGARSPRRVPPPSPNPTDAYRASLASKDHLGASWASMNSPEGPRRDTLDQYRKFGFDQLFDQYASDDEVFGALQGELTAAVGGDSVCIFAYGATGSGKTHTVMNIAARTAKELEKQARLLEEEGLRLELSVQVVEIYNEQLRDLLAEKYYSHHPDHEPPRLRLSVSNSTPTLQGASTRTINADSAKGIARSLEEALKAGQAQRATSCTSVHGRSSRSHLVMTLHLGTCDASTGVLQRQGKLSLVDLAGSERVKRSEAVGDRLREAQHINRSLSALADVISAKERRGSHVPYRNSKLTHLLQDALGGTGPSRTVVIVALPPTRASLNETMHSLQFSSRLSSLSLQTASQRSLLSTRARADTDSVEGERLRADNARLRLQLDRFERLLEERDVRLEAKERQIESLQQQVRSLELRKDPSKKDIMAPASTTASGLQSGAEMSGSSISGSPAASSVSVSAGSTMTGSTTHFTKRSIGSSVDKGGSLTAPSGSSFGDGGRDTPLSDARASPTTPDTGTPCMQDTPSLESLPCVFPTCVYQSGVLQSAGINKDAAADREDLLGASVRHVPRAAGVPPSPLRRGSPCTSEPPPMQPRLRHVRPLREVLPAGRPPRESSSQPPAAQVISTREADVALASPEPPPIGRELLDESGRMRTGPPGPLVGLPVPTDSSGCPLTPSSRASGRTASQQSTPESRMSFRSCREVRYGSAGKTGADVAPDSASQVSLPATPELEQRNARATPAEEQGTDYGFLAWEQDYDEPAGPSIDLDEDQLMITVPRMSAQGSPPPPASSSQARERSTTARPCAVTRALAESTTPLNRAVPWAPPMREQSSGSSRIERDSSASSASRRKNGTPREYVVEVISHELARELTAGQAVIYESPRHKAFQARNPSRVPPSPAILLRPEEEAVYAGAAGLQHSDSAISLSSDEIDIKDRLQQALQLEQPKLSTPATGTGPTSTDGHTPVTPITPVPVTAARAISRLTSQWGVPSGSPRQSSGLSVQQGMPLRPGPPHGVTRLSTGPSAGGPLVQHGHVAHAAKNWPPSSLSFGSPFQTHGSRTWPPPPPASVATSPALQASRDFSRVTPLRQASPPAACGAAPAPCGCSPHSPCACAASPRQQYGLASPPMTWASPTPGPRTPRMPAYQPAVSPGSVSLCYGQRR